MLQRANEHSRIIYSLDAHGLDALTSCISLYTVVSSAFLS